MSEARTKGAPRRTVRAPDLDNVLEETFRARDGEARTEVQRELQALVAEVEQGVDFGSARAEQALRARIAQLDALLSEQLSAVMHEAKFRALEGSWRGLHQLVKGANTSRSLKVHVLPATKRELLRDAVDAPEFDQSELFKKVYDREYGQFGGAPYAALIGDYEWSHDYDDLRALKGIARVAAAAHAPFVSAASPRLFKLDDYTRLNEPRDLALIFESKEHAGWRAFRDTEDSRYVGLTLPRVMARMPYGSAGQRIEAFDFEEKVTGGAHDRFVWSNAAYAFAGRLADAFDRHGWCVAVRGVEGGGLVTELPTHTYEGPGGDVVMKCPTEIPIADTREAQLYKLGFLPLLHRKDTPDAAFLSGQSLRRIRKWSTPEASANDRLSAQIPYLMAASRFAHYVKSIMRDKVGSFAERGDVERFLNEWFAQYILLDDKASQGMKAKFPLREARVDVRAKPGMPGYYEAAIYLRPHFQLEELDASIRLVAELPPPAKER